MAHTVRSVPLSIFKDPGPPDSLLSCCDPPFRCHGLYAMGIFRFRLPIMENISIGFSSFCFNCVRSHWDQPIFAWVELKLQISSKITKPSYNVLISSWFLSMFCVRVLAEWEDRTGSTAYQRYTSTEWLNFSWTFQDAHRKHFLSLY